MADDLTCLILTQHIVKRLNISVINNGHQYFKRFLTGCYNLDIEFEMFAFTSCLLGILSAFYTHSFCRYYSRETE